jgi:hypothetical protein
MIDGFIPFLAQVIFPPKLVIGSVIEGELSAKVIFHLSWRMAWRWPAITASPRGLLTDCPGRRLSPNGEPQSGGVLFRSLNVRSRRLFVGRFDDSFCGGVSGWWWYRARAFSDSVTGCGSVRQLSGNNQPDRSIDSNRSPWPRRLLIRLTNVRPPRDHHPSQS